MVEFHYLQKPSWEQESGSIDAEAQSSSDVHFTYMIEPGNIKAQFKVKPFYHYCANETDEASIFCFYFWNQLKPLPFM